MTPPPSQERLRKELGLYDVYAISTGAMFSSGFFLLPGLAAAQTGPSVALAYFVAGLFILPAMFSVAELATAMPRAGGAYYVLDRSMGPMVGTVGGLGTWLALVLKSAFALVGMGAYLALYVNVPIEPLAIVLTVVFTIVNVVGAKETSGLQRILVTALVLIMAVFIVQGVTEVAAQGARTVTQERFTPFLAFGLTGFMGTVGFVFVSYAGLTKVASVSEEVRNPDRNIPLGMMLSLATATVVYTVGVMIMVALLPADELREDLTPVATTAATFDGLPGESAVILVVIAAVAAFASTGNAGILSASRYPMAMARDHLISPGFSRVGRFGTPTRSIVLTSGLMIASIAFLDIESIAKLASAFQLLLFSLLCLAVVIMRESGIEGYDPGYRSPLYPWMQLAGFLAPLWLIAEMGQMAMLFTLGLVAATVGWYIQYARHRVERSGAIFHTFARLGEMRHGGLDLELRGIVKEKGLREEDPFEEVVARAPVLDFAEPVAFSELTEQACSVFADLVGVSAETLEDGFRAEMKGGFMPIARRAALPHLRVADLERPMMLLARCAKGLTGVDTLAEGTEVAPAPDGVEAPADHVVARAEDVETGVEDVDERTKRVEARAEDADAPSEDVEVRTEDWTSDAEPGTEGRAKEFTDLRAVFFLVSPLDQSGQHLRLLGHLATHIDDPAFLGQWLEADTRDALRGTLLRAERSLTLRVTADGPTSGWSGHPLRAVDLPDGTLVALVRRDRRGIVPNGSTVLREGDSLTLIGTPEGIQTAVERFDSGRAV